MSQISPLNVLVEMVKKRKEVSVPVEVFEQDICGDIGDEALAAIIPIAKKYGLEVIRTRGSFTPMIYLPRFEFSIQIHLTKEKVV